MFGIKNIKLNAILLDLVTLEPQLFDTRQEALDYLTDNVTTDEEMKDLKVCSVDPDSMGLSSLKENK